MPIFISGIKLPFTAPKQEALALARRRLGLSRGEIAREFISKISLDARKKDRQIYNVYTVGFVLALPPEEEKRWAERCRVSGVICRPQERQTLVPGQRALLHRPVIAGFGPAGMFAALLLAQNGYSPLVLERGGSVEERTEAVQAFWAHGKLNSESNVQFGEGGAGTFSDGKLTTRISDVRCAYVLEQFVRHGAPQEIAWQAKPHIGTDQLRQVVRSIRQEIIRLGGEVRFHTQMTGLHLTDARLTGVKTTQGDVPAQALVLALGHSARDTFTALLQQSLPMQSKAFSVGVRIEHLQHSIDKGLYGSFAGHPKLPPGEYQLSYRVGQQAVYTFCMCPGGYVVPAASEEGAVVTNGMSEFARDGQNANSALVVSVDPSDFGEHVLDGVAFQRRLERLAFEKGGSWSAPAQDVGSFLSGRPGLVRKTVEPTYALGVRECDFAEIFPAKVTGLLQAGLSRFGRQLPGFDAPDAVMTGVETRTSSPIRILRSEEMQSPGIAGVYPCGEGAGYAGGIMSAAVDGMKVAEQIIKTYSPDSGR